MKKITDERLVLQNLKNIRIAYIVQTIGILGILGYDLVTKGLKGMRDNPLWLVFMITAVVSGYLSMNISVEHENDQMNSQKKFRISIATLVFISFVVGLLVSFSNTIMDALLIGGILFICGLIPIVYIYHLRKKQQEEIEEE